MWPICFIKDLKALYLNACFYLKYYQTISSTCLHLCSVKEHSLALCALSSLLKQSVWSVCSNNKLVGVDSLPRKQTWEVSWKFDGSCCNVLLFSFVFVFSLFWFLRNLCILKIDKFILRRLHTDDARTRGNFV